MTLIEAIQSGKPFRRPQWPDYLDVKETHYFYLSVEDLLTTDYYVEEKKVTITEEQFNEAVARTRNLYYKGQWYWTDALKKELGL
jgi:hypothetical protein